MPEKAPANRPETGTMRFGSDWTGAFFKEAAEELDSRYDGTKYRSDPQVARARAYILEGFDPVKLRASWDTYLKAACALLGEM